jgi:hypothetical protein
MPEIEREFVDRRSATDEEPPRFDMDEIIRQLEKEIVSDFVRKIVPVREVIRVNFLTDDDMPDLSEGINAAAGGYWERSVALFESAGVKYATLKPDVLAKCFYDLGLALEFDHRYSDARSAFNKASSLDPGTSMYMGAYADCNAREAEWKRLLDQHWD